MFLQELNQKERKNFLELATYAMKVNGELHPEQISIIDTFRMETGLEGYEVLDKNLDELIQSFQASTKKIKKVVLIELFGVILADGKFGDIEKGMVDAIVEKWNIKNRDVIYLQNWVIDFNELLQDGYEFIMK